MARGIERIFDNYRWMIFGQTEDKSKSDIVENGNGNDIFTLMDTELAEQIVDLHNEMLGVLMEELKNLYGIK